VPKVKTEKSIDEVLKEEFLRERAAVLSRASEKLTKTLDLLARIEENICKDTKAMECLAQMEASQRGAAGDRCIQKKSIVEQINRHIDQFNKTRENAKLDYYYLIVTREALGLRKHHWVEEFYSIPPKKRYVKDV